jgi:hypothetical protein
MDLIDGRTIGPGAREGEFHAIFNSSRGNVIESLYRILSVALPTFDQTLRLLTGDSQEWPGCAGQEHAAYAHAFSAMVDVGLDDEDEFTQDLLQMIARMPSPVIR